MHSGNLRHAATTTRSLLLLLLLLRRWRLFCRGGVRRVGGRLGGGRVRRRVVDESLAARAKEFPFEKGVVRRELFQLQLQLGNRRLLRPHDSL
ncbi:MAG: hypothetical protein U1A77_00455 [Pirellulales bacterium]